MKDCWCSVEKIPLKSKLPMKSVKALETISYFTDLSKAKASRSSKPQPRSLENQYLTLEASSRLRTVVSKSSIQGRGVFATQPFEKGEVVMEYTGELVRPIIADARESFYKQYGLGDYVFRLTDSVYIDATFKGNNARFINHSCEPNCKSLVVNIEGEAKIIIISARDIEAGEELSYDYKFDWEDEKKKEECRCGALNCKKYLNYIDRVKKRG
jgi:SET domain-containing protein